MLKIDELRAEVTAKKEEVRGLLADNKVEDAETKMTEVRNLEKNIKIQEELDAEERANVKTKIDKKVEDSKMENRELTAHEVEKRDAKQVRSYIKHFAGKAMTEEERALVVSGTSGENLILPQTVSTKIKTLIRSYKSMRDVLGYIPSTTLTGSFPVENFDMVTGLVDFSEDGTNELSESTDIKFINKSYSLKEKGAFIALSNTLLAMTDNDLMNYVAQVFAKKAVITENAMGIAALKNGKTTKAIADWKALKKSLNVDLNEAVKYGTVIVTNQDAFDVLDSAMDATNGRPLLQPDPTNPTLKRFAGYPVVVFDNSLLPTTGTTTKKAPIFYGLLSEAVKFVDAGKYSFATSEHAAFLKNMTLAKVIEYVDCIQVDSSDKCYIAGELTIA